MDLYFQMLDLCVCVTAIPLCLAALVVHKEHNLTVCFIKEGLVMFNSTSSLVCIMLISLDRYTAVVRPTSQIFTPRRVRVCRVIVVLSATVGAILPSFSFLMGSYSQAKLDSVRILHCRYVVWLFQPHFFYEFYYIVLFIATVLIVFICYNSVLKTAKKRLVSRMTFLTVSDPGRVASETGKRRLESKATKMTLAIIVCFIVCWGPHVIVTFLQFGMPGCLEIDMLQTCCLFLAFMSPVIHPLIYSYENKRRGRTNVVGSAENGGSRLSELSKINASLPLSPSADFISSVDSYTFNSTATFASSNI